MNATASQFETTNATNLVAYFVGAALITFALFVVMDKLTRNDLIAEPPLTTVIDTDFVLSESEPEVITKKPLPTPPEPKAVPKTAPPEAQPTVNEAPDFSQYVPPKPQFEVQNEYVSGSQSGFATPIVRIQPNYPVDAARDGIEGWVQLQFTIDASGKVRDVEVVDAQPKRIFDREARRAMLRWKYKPTLVNGKPVEQSGMSVVLEFKLDGSQS